MGAYHRSSRRFAPLAGTERAVLRYKGSDYEVLIKDISSGGYGIIADMDCPILRPEKAILVTDSGQHVVRAVKIEPDGSSLIIGLELIEDVPADEQTNPILSWMLGSNPWHYSAGRMFSGLMITVVLVLVGFACSLLYLAGQAIVSLTDLFSDKF